MLDRVTPPPFKKVERFHIKQVQKTTLDNGRNLFHLNHGDQEVFKLEFLIRAGSLYVEQYELVPLTLRMLNEGTLKRSGSEMTNAIDSLGAFVEFSPGFDFASINFYGLTKHFEKIVNLANEILHEPKFGDQEFENLKKKEIQKIQLNQEKNGYLSSVKFRNSIFGDQHPYGKKSSIEGVQDLSVTEVRQLFSSHYQDYDILLSGLLPNNFESVLNDFFGQDSFQRVNGIEEKERGSGSEVFVHKPKSIQSSIKIGKVLFSRDHPDYIKLLVTNELLGGFFGSRLMKNIREEKGLTYGIYSHLYALSAGGYFSISTDVKGELTRQATDEIFKEIQKLQSELVGEDELETVKNYMLGTFSAAVSTPFSLMDRFKAIHYQGLGYDYYEKYFDTLEEIQPEGLMDQTQKHLSISSLTTCIVGPTK